MYFSLSLTSQAYSCRRLKGVPDTYQLILKGLKRRQQDENTVNKISYSSNCILPFPDPESDELTITRFQFSSGSALIETSQRSSAAGQGGCACSWDHEVCDPPNPRPLGNHQVCLLALLHLLDNQTGSTWQCTKNWRLQNQKNVGEKLSSEQLASGSPWAI